MLCVAVAALLGLPDGARAQDAGSQAGQLWKEAQLAFAAGDYARASSSLEAIVKSSAATAKLLDKSTPAAAPANVQWLEPVLFMLGAARFDAKEWPQAISIFEKYQLLFPNSSRLTQVRFSLGQTDLFGGRPEAAIPLFQSLLANPDYHRKAFMLLVEATRHAGRAGDAIALMEKEKAAPDLAADYKSKIDIELLTLYLEKGSDQKAIDLLQEMSADIAHVPDVPAFNGMAVRLGEVFLEKNDIANALSCYRQVRDNEQILALQKLQIDNLQRQQAAVLKSIQADPLNSSQRQLEAKDIQVQMAWDQSILNQYQTLPPVLPPLFLRIARAYFLAGSLWEAGVVYSEIMRRFPHSDEAESALYGSIVIFDQLKRTDRAQLLCQNYLTQYPTGKYADSVGFLRGALAYDAQDFDKAIGYFEDSLKNQPNNPRREQTEVIIGDIKLRLGKFDEAIAAYQAYQKEFPGGRMTEQVEYRSGLALLFAGKAEEADKAIRAYLQKYPKGTYAADGEYRLDVIKFAAKQYDEVLADGKVWQQKHGSVGPLAEVLTLMGDCYAEQDKSDEAVKTYIKSYKVAQSTDVLNYAIFAAAKILQKQAKWTEISDMFREFVKDNPDHPTVVSALSWIGRADLKLGKEEEGKQFLAATAKKYLDDPNREAVDEIITQLAQLYAHKHLAVAPPVVPVPPAPVTASTTATAAAPVVAAPVPAAPPAPPATDPAKDLEDVLTIPDLASKATARARILYAKAELARIQRKPEIEGQLLGEIAQGFKPEELSPILLGRVGDRLMQTGQPAAAIPYYNQLMDAYDQSPDVDYAYNGLGKIAFDQKDYLKAERYYSKALDKGLAAAKLKDITLGQAQTLLALNRPNDARPLFEQVAGTRAWRGEATALSVYSLGEIQMDQGKYAEANAYYQRVFVAYQKYPDIQAKAYLRSGEAFEKLGKIPEAINTYSEMMKNPNLVSFPEFLDAKDRLQHLAQK